MIKRRITPLIIELSAQYPVIALTGPRQSGKTTLLKNAFPNYQYVSLEDLNIREFAQSDPVGFLKRYNEKVIFDEVQRVPDLFSYIQTKVDERGIMGQFILSGSQNFQLLASITQSLAGRVALFKLLPFDFSELKDANLLPEDYCEILLKGSYPALFDRNIASKIFYANYIQTYIQRDVVELINVKDLGQFKVFLSLCAARAGQMLNISALSNECDIPQPKAKAWLSVLESSFITFQVLPYYKNFNKRIIKTPKLYFYDTGLVCHLLGIKTIEDLDTFKGNLFENLIISEFYKQNEHQYLHNDFFYWRDSNGNEVDLLCPKAMKFEIFEIKSSQTIKSDHFKGLNYLNEISENAVSKKTLIYGGNESQERTHYSIKSWKDV
jgi:uncharacterized protein